MRKRLKQEPTLKDIAVFFALILLISFIAIVIMTIALIATG